ncbi:MAG: putative toxin-antitoxin system toxin component, PIN family [Phycisphaerae bacterium]|nr:putative toxin-antitoxin system toxin component, PIN family [Phycisphaerae bacterium]
MDYRIVIDTNTLLRGILSETSAAAKVRRAAEARLIVPLLSKPVLDEYRAVLGHPSIALRFSISRKQVSFLIARLLFVGDYVRTPHARFEYRRDPGDRKFIELAIELAATHIITSDNDLLSLPLAPGDAGRRFRQRLPNVVALEAADFLNQLRSS